MRRNLRALIVPRAPLFGRPFLLASLAVFLCGLALHPYVHLPGLLERYHSDELTTGTIVALMSVSALLVRPLVGRIMDARGRRIVIISGAVLQLIACLLYDRAARRTAVRLRAWAAGAWVRKKWSPRVEDGPAEPHRRRDCVPERARVAFVGAWSGDADTRK